MAKRQAGNPALSAAVRAACAGETGPVLTSRLSQPLHWKTGRVIAVQLMGDLFHPSVPFEWIDRIYAVMALCPSHRFMVLTKRVERMAEYVNAVTFERLRVWMNRSADGGDHRPGAYSLTTLACRSVKGTEYEFRRTPSPPLPNVWHGVTICNQAEADAKIPVLLQIPGKLWVSYEPALSAVDFTPWLPAEYWCPCGYSGNHAEEICTNCGEEFPRPGPDGGDLPCSCGCESYEDQCPECGEEVYKWSNTRGPDSENAASEKALAMRVNRLSYIAAGGETGPGARPAHPDWFRQVRDDCEAAGAGFHFKHHGEWRAIDSANWTAGISGVHSGQNRMVHTCEFDGGGTATGSYEWRKERGATFVRVGKAIAGNVLDGRTHEEEY